MSRSLPAGKVVFDHVTKRYVIGKSRAHLAGAWPFGSGLGRGQQLKALDDVSFTIEPGEAFALMGANGAGKSTALKCLAGITKPTSGSVAHGGRVVALIELGVGFHPDLSGLENARFAAAIAGLRGAAAKRLVDAAVEFSELESFITTPVKRYSSGMYARLSFGIAANLPADVLIIDEILAVGDLAFQRKCYSKLAELRGTSGATLLFVSHNEWVLKETCDRGVLVAKGKIVGEGPVGQILDLYHSLGSPVPERTQPEEAGKFIRLGGVRFGEDDERTVALHDDLRVRIEIDIAEQAVEPVVGIAMFDKDVRLIWGSYSDENGLPLRPGRQEVDVTIRDVDVLPGPARFEVFTFDRSDPMGQDYRRFDLTIEGDAANDWEHGLVHARTEWATTPEGAKRSTAAGRRKPARKATGRRS